MDQLIVRWLRRALHNLDELAEYISQDNPEAASRTVQRLGEAVRRLSTYPKMGRPGRIQGTRELVVSGTPYVVAYRIANGRVDVLRVVHGAMRWPKRP